MNLNDKYAKYFPDFPYPEVTIKQILSNTSGVPDDGDVFRPFFRLNHDTSLTLNDLMPALKTDQVPLDFNAGEHWEYSDLIIASWLCWLKRSVAKHLAITFLKTFSNLQE